VLNCELGLVKSGLGLGFLSCGLANIVGFYRAMHYSAKRGIAIACRLSVRP